MFPCLSSRSAPFLSNSIFLNTALHPTVASQSCRPTIRSFASISQFPCIILFVLLKHLAIKCCGMCCYGSMRSALVHSHTIKQHTSLVSWFRQVQLCAALATVLLCSRLFPRVQLPPWYVFHSSHHCLSQLGHCFVGCREQASPNLWRQ